MAEQVKRRVAAARLAVAFVAAGTIAGASAWATASPPPAAETSAAAQGEHIKKAILNLTGEDIVDGTLLFEDFNKNEVQSFKDTRHFQKVVFSKYKKATFNKISSIKGELGDIKSQVDGIKGELSSYVKLGDADARYVKIGAPLVRGDGQVLTASKDVGAQTFTRLAEVQGMFTVDAQGPMVRITNTGSLPIQHSSCPTGAGGPPLAAGEIEPGGHIDCIGDGSVMPVQLIDAAGPGGGPRVATLNLFSWSWGANTYRSTVQILIGL